MRFVMECGPCDGDLGYAKELVDVLADTQARNRDIALSMKVQFYTADTLAALDSPRYDRTDDSPVSQRQLFGRQLGWDQWAEVARYARSKSLDFFPTVFSPQAVDKAVEMQLFTLKTASGDLTYQSLIRYAASRASTLVISTGAGLASEISAALDNRQMARIVLLACHLAYPSDEAHLLRITTLRQLVHEDWEVEVGYSDHTRGVDTVAPLTSLGAVMWEKHFTLRSRNEGDHTFAITPPYLDRAIDTYRTTKRLLGSDSLTPTPSEFAARLGARRSLAAATTIPALTPITRDNTTWLRPATGISFSDAALIFDRAVATRDIPIGSTITADMVISGPAPD